MTTKCISCHKRVTNVKATVRFQCPQCGNYEIVRCGDCRRNAVNFTCPACEFTGPN